MTSSGHPEGSFDQCPICGTELTVEPLLRFGDATCPNCETLLWYHRFADQTRFYPHEASSGLRERIIGKIAEQFGVEPSKVTGDMRVLQDELGADSLDTVEIVMELEEEFDSWE